MICLLSAVDLLLSSSAAHYCSRKAARSGERQAGREGWREGGRMGGRGKGMGGGVVLSRPADSGAAVMADTVTRQSGKDHRHHHHCCGRLWIFASWMQQRDGPDTVSRS